MSSTPMAVCFSADGPQVFEESGEGCIVLFLSSNVTSFTGALLAFETGCSAKIGFAPFLQRYAKKKNPGPSGSTGVV